jgi:hypothetical protein
MLDNLGHRPARQTAGKPTQTTPDSLKSVWGVSEWPKQASLARPPVTLPPGQRRRVATFALLSLELIHRQGQLLSTRFT